MPYQAGLAHTIPELKTGAKHCTRCGKEFHLFRLKKNCRNCGCMVCESCSSFKTRLPQFGYTQEVRVCSYCAHFRHVYNLDAAALSKLDIKTLRGYLQSYNLSTKGMLEKQDLVNAVQSHRPIPDRSEIYFRAHLPPDATPNASFFNDLFGTGSESGPSTSAKPKKSAPTSGTASSGSTSSYSDSDDGWSWDPDSFFSKLFGIDSSETNRPAPQSSSHRAPQSSSQGARPQPTAQSRPQANHQSRGQPHPQSYPYSQSQTNARPTHPYTPYPTTYPQMPTGHSAMPSHQQYQQSPMSSGYTRPAERARPTETARPTEQTRPRAQTGSGSSSGTSETPRETFTQTSRGYSSSNPTPRPPTSSSPQQSSGSGGSALTLDDVISPDVDLSSLSIKVIKSLLDAHSVSYVNVVEKSDLVARLQTLVNNARIEQGIRNPSPPPSSNPLPTPRSPQGGSSPSSSQEGVKNETKREEKSSDNMSNNGSGETSATSSAASQPSQYNEDEDMCKICFDAKINCVMLNCGHLATCQPCGKLIMEGTRTCPICRQYVIRLLHVFRA